MAFESTPKVPNAQLLIDQMFAASRNVKTKKKRGDNSLVVLRKRSREQLTAMSSSLAGALRQIPRGFPDTNNITEFYRQLFREDFDLDEYRKRLARIQQSTKVLARLTRQFRGRIEGALTEDQIYTAMNSAMGRYASVAKRLDNDFTWFNDIRKHLLDYPTIKEVFTVCIAGFPNVGKTTLFAELTGSKAEVNNYAFTTKRLNAGMWRTDARKVQLIDTPGTLNRDKTNRIERQAEYALKYLADVIVYVYDPTETYTIEKQDALYEVISSYDKEVILYLSKADIVSDERINWFVENRNTLSKKELLTTLRERVLKAN